MKKYISYILGLSVSAMFSQHSPQTIYCNERQNVALVMSAPIIQAVTGSENFVFSYNQTAVDSLGLLQGMPGKDSNLLIRTKDGALYSYLLKYSDSLSRFVQFIQPEDRINTLSKEKETIKKRIILKRNNIHDHKESYKGLSAYYLERTPERLAIKRKNKLILEVQGLYYYRDEVFMVIEFKNNSKVDFKIDALSLSKIHGMKGRKSSYQKLVLNEKSRKFFQEVVHKRTNSRFVMVFPKFTLGDHDKLQLVITEETGSRYLKLTFD